MYFLKTGGLRAERRVRRRGRGAAVALYNCWEWGGERKVDLEMGERIRKECSHKQAAGHIPGLSQETPALARIQEHTYPRKSS